MRPAPSRYSPCRRPRSRWLHCHAGDFELQGLTSPGEGIRFTLTLGGGSSASNIIKIATPNGNVNANVIGQIALNNDNSQYGSAGNRVTFQVTPGGLLTASTANAQGVVAGAATASAKIVVQNGGALAIGNPAALNGPVTILPGGIFTQNQSTLTGPGALTHSNGSILSLTNASAVSGATQTLGTVPGTIVRMAAAGFLPGGTASAILAGTVGADKTTTGTATLSGAYTYDGPTSINEGTLALTGNGSVANSPTIAIASGATLDVSGVTGGANHDGTRFAVVNGQTLKGTGTVGGAMNISAGGTIAPGNSIGTLAIDSLSLTGANSVFELEIDLGLTPAADLLNVTGEITLAGSTLDLSLFNLSPMGLPETFLFAANDASEAVDGIFATITGLPVGYVATVDYAFAGTDSLGRVGDGNDIAITLSVEAVPEPSTIVWGLAVGVLAIDRRRRVRR